jgi:hypothetical protein
VLHVLEVRRVEPGRVAVLDAAVVVVVVERRVVLDDRLPALLRALLRLALLLRLLLRLGVLLRLELLLLLGLGLLARLVLVEPAEERAQDVRDRPDGGVLLRVVALGLLDLGLHGALALLDAVPLRHAHGFGRGIVERRASAVVSDTERKVSRGWTSY